MQEYNVIKKIKANVDGRDFVIGDLHGCYDELIKLLKYIKFNEKTDRLFSTGDLIDRGPKSQLCVELLNQPWFFSVIGNHEDRYLKQIRDLKEGKDEKLDEEEKQYRLSLEKYIEKIKEMPLIYEVEHLFYDKIYIVHAEILPEHLFNFDNHDDEEYKRKLNDLKTKNFDNEFKKFFNNLGKEKINHKLQQKLLWSRTIIDSFYIENKELILQEDFSFIKNKHGTNKIKIFCGHNIVPFPMKIGQQYYVDTGAALGYEEKKKSSILFSKFGHKFFTLSITDITTGMCYGVITSKEKQGQMVKFSKSIYLE